MAHAAPTLTRACPVEDRMPRGSAQPSAPEQVQETMVAEKGIPALRQYGARPSPACRAPAPAARLSPACRAPVARLSRVRRPPAARPSPACRAPVARPSPARRPPVARPSPARRARVARPSRACRPPAARSSRACRATGARQGPDRYQTFNIIIIIYYY